MLYLLSVYFASLDTMNLVMMLGMLVCMSFLMSLCIFTVSNALLKSSATVIVHVGGCFWLKPVVNYVV